MKLEDQFKAAKYLLEYDGCKVPFPFPKPYNAQEKIIRNFLRCAREKLNLLAESPTGTGKTAAMLAAAIAWLWAYDAYIEKLDNFKNGVEIHKKRKLVSIPDTPPKVPKKEENREIPESDEDQKSEANIKTEVSQSSNTQMKLEISSDQNMSLITQDSSNKILESSDNDIISSDSEYELSGESERLIDELSSELRSTNIQEETTTSGVNESDIESLGSDFSDDFRKNELDEFRITLQKCDNLMTDFEKNCRVFLDYKKRPKIWIGSRTHQQVDQIMEELKSFGSINKIVKSRKEIYSQNHRDHPYAQNIVKIKY